MAAHRRWLEFPFLHRRDSRWFQLRMPTEEGTNIRRSSARIYDEGYVYLVDETVVRSVLRIQNRSALDQYRKLNIGIGRFFARERRRFA